MYTHLLQCPTSSSPCLLKPPPLLGSLKVLDESLHFDSTHATIPSLVTKSKIPKNTNFDQINSTTAHHHHAPPQAHQSSPDVNSSGGQQGGETTTTTTAAAAASESQGPFQRSSSCKKQRSGSSKRKKSKTKSESDSCDVVVLNNGRERSQISRSDQHILYAVNRIQNDTREEAIHKPPRRMSTISGGSASQRRASLAANNNQFYVNLGRRSSKNINSPICLSRRMSSIEHAYEKVSNININNFEQPVSVKTEDKTKLDITALQQSLTNINIPRRTSVLNEYYEMQVQSPSPSPPHSKLRALVERLKPHQFIEERDSYSLYIFPETNR